MVFIYTKGPKVLPNMRKPNMEPYTTKKGSNLGIQSTHIDLVPLMSYSQEVTE